MTALAFLPPVTDIGEDPLVPGAWCWNAPLWGNPLLPQLREPGARPGLEARHPALRGCQALRTVGNAVRAVAEVQCVTDGWDEREGAARPLSERAVRNRSRAWRSFLAECLDPTGPRAKWDDWRRWAECSAALSALLSDIPDSWLLAARVVVPLTARGRAGLVMEVEEVEMMLVQRLGWRLADGTSLALHDYTVRHGTTMQLAAVEASRSTAHRRFVSEALGLAEVAPQVQAESARLSSTIHRLWGSVRWENANKEAYWRLTVDGIPLLGNSHMRNAAPARCGCGHFPIAARTCPPRLHHFWHCRVAQAVVEQVEARVGAPIRREQLWLGVCPPGLEQCVWDVVVLAAVSAVETGRRFMAAGVRGASDAPPGGLAERAARRAVTDFWGRLQGFAALKVPRRGWDAVGARHPILRVVEGRLVCVGPPPSPVDDP